MMGNGMQFGFEASHLGDLYSNAALGGRGGGSRFSPGATIAFQFNPVGSSPTGGGSGPVRFASGASSGGGLVDSEARSLGSASLAETKKLTQRVLATEGLLGRTQALFFNLREAGAAFDKNANPTQRILSAGSALSGIVNSPTLANFAKHLKPQGGGLGAIGTALGALPVVGQVAQIAMLEAAGIEAFASHIRERGDAWEKRWRTVDALTRFSTSKGLRQRYVALTGDVTGPDENGVSVGGTFLKNQMDIQRVFESNIALAVRLSGRKGFQARAALADWEEDPDDISQLAGEMATIFQEDNNAAKRFAAQFKRYEQDRNAHLKTFQVASQAREGEARVQRLFN